MVLAGTASVTERSMDYTPATLSLMHWSQRPVSPTLGSLPLIEAFWSGILLARQPAIIDRHRGLFSLKKEFIYVVEGPLRRVNRLPTGHLFR